MTAVLVRGPYHAKTDRVAERVDWGRVRILGDRVQNAVIAERPDVAHQSGAELVSLAERRLRQLGDAA